MTRTKRDELNDQIDQFLDQYNLTAEDKATYRAHFDALNKNASDAEAERMFADLQTMLQQQKLRKN